MKHKKYISLEGCGGYEWNDSSFLYMGEIRLLPSLAYLDSSLQGLKRVVVSQGELGTGKFINLEAIGNELVEVGYHI